MTRSAALVLLLAMVAAACGGGGDALVLPTESAPAADPDQPVSSSPLDPGAVGDPSPAQPELVEPRPGMTDVVAIPFEDAEVVGDDDRTVRLTFYSGVAPCHVLDSVDVDTGPEQVTLTLYQGSDPDHPDAVCIQIAELKAVEVVLDEPVGDREISDGAET